MKIKSFRVKVTLILILIILIIISTIWGLSSYLLNLNLKERVKREINSYKRVISYIIELEKWTLEKQIKDYSLWKELGERAVIKKDKTWIKSNLNPWVKNTLGYDVILFTEDRKIITSSFSFPIEKIELTKEIKVSIIKVGKDFYIYGVGPVYDENIKKFYGAYLLFAKKIDSEYIRELEKIIDAKITFIFSNQANRSILEEYYRYPYIHLSIPLNNEFYIVIDKQDPSLYEFNKLLLTILGISLGVILLFSIVFMQILLNHIFKPFERLVDISHNIANGKYDVELMEDREDEFGDFIKVFKHMISKIKEREEKLIFELKETEKLTYLDPLTRLYNRRFLEEKYEYIKRNYDTFVLVFVDLDNFKEINDRWGHELGDKVLIEVAEFFRRNFREYDFVVRYGGDEFCIILVNVDKEKAERILERIKNKFEIEILNFFGFNLSFTYGVAEYPKDGESLDTLVKIADERMYKHKK